MKKVLNIISAGILSIGLVSCGLNGVENLTEQSTDNFPANTTDADATLAGI
jgi:hypothetical protein